MTDLPEAVLATAFDLVEAMQSNKMDALTAGDARYANMLTDDANAIARALMAAAKEADEAATKRERERCAARLKEWAEKNDEYLRNVPSLRFAQEPRRGAEQRRRDAMAKHAWAYRNAAAILKGEA